MNTPEVYTSVENTPEGDRFYAEVVRNAGERNEEVLYVTGFFNDENDARADAESWLARRRGWCNDARGDLHI